MDLGPDVQLRELADNVDIMDPGIDRESILLYRQQIEVLSFPIPPLVMEFFARCGVSPLMINPCVLILLQAFATTNLALKGSHLLSFYDFLICYRLKFYSGPKDERDSWFTTMRFEDKGIFYKILSSMKKDRFREWSINRPIIFTGYWCRKEHMESYVLSYAFRKKAP